MRYQFVGMKFLVASLSLLLLQAGWATDVTVNSSGGGDYTTIQAALDAIQKEAIGRDGEPDTITILDSARYDEQLNIGNIPEAPFTLTEQEWLDQVDPETLDPITIQGAEGQNPGIGFTGSDLVSYGVFPNDPGDNFNANIAFLGTEITFRRVNLIYTEELGTVSEGYMLNGQARDLIFEDVYFGYGESNTFFGGEDYLNLNNSDILARDEGIDNSTTVFRNCEVDGTQADIFRTGNTFLYFHGFDSFREGEPPLTPEVIIENSNIQRWNDVIRLRGRQADREYSSILASDSYFTDIRTGLRVGGNGMVKVERCLFTFNINDLDINSDGGLIFLGERSGWCPEGEISNSVFYNNGSYDAGADESTPNALIRVHSRTDATTGPVIIDHCTFDTNGRVIWMRDGTHPREVIVSNSIFTKQDFSVIDLTEYADNDPTLVSGSMDKVLEFENWATFVPDDVNFPNITMGELIQEDPLYDPATTSIDTNAPWAVPAFELTEASPAIDMGDDSLTIGDMDVDGDPRISRDASDLGGQELDLGPPTTSDPPVIISINGTGASVSIAWTGDAAAYQVQRAEMVTGPWDDLGEPTSENSATDDSPPSPVAYYRVIPMGLPL